MGANMKVIKRDGHSVDFDDNKIRIAIEKANKEVSEEERATDKEIDNIIKYIINLNKKRILVEDIQDIIELKLMQNKHYILAKKYIVYRYTRALVRKSNTTDETILSIIKNKNNTLDNSLNNIASLEKNYIAREVSIDLTRRLLLPEKIVKAHDEGIIYFHDMDYFVEPMFNSSIININKMFNNNIYLNNRYLSIPNNLNDASIMLIDIIDNILANQYGSISIDLSILGYYLSLTKDNIKSNKYSKRKEDKLINDNITYNTKLVINEIYNLILDNNQKVILYMKLDEDNKYIDDSYLIYKSLLDYINIGINNKDNINYISNNIEIVLVLNDILVNKYNSLLDTAIDIVSKNGLVSFINESVMNKYYGKTYSIMDNNYINIPIKVNNSILTDSIFNQGIVSINLVNIALSSNSEDEFFKLLDERINLTKEALVCRNHALQGLNSKVSPLHYEYGGISSLKDNDKIDNILTSNSTLTIGYIGLKEASEYLKIDNISEKIIDYISNKCKIYKDNLNMNFDYREISDININKYLVTCDRNKYGSIKNITNNIIYHNEINIDINNINKDSYKEIGIFTIKDIRNNKDKIHNIINNIGNKYVLVKFRDNNYCMSCGSSNIYNNKCLICNNSNIIDILDNKDINVSIIYL